MENKPYATISRTSTEVKPGFDQKAVLLKKQEEKYGYFSCPTNGLYGVALPEWIPEIEHELKENSAREFEIRGAILITLVDDLIEKTKRAGKRHCPILTESLEGLLSLVGAKEE